MISKTLSNLHKQYNSGKLKEGRLMHTGRPSFIENQQEWTDVKYGWHPKSNMGYSGCGVFAVWNVLYAMKRLGNEAPVEKMVQLIEHFERWGTLAGGLFGTRMVAVCFYLMRHCKTVKSMLPVGRKRLDRFGRQNDAFIVFMLNDWRHPFCGAHIVAITKDGKGFVPHNVYRRDAQGKYLSGVPADSLFLSISHCTKRPLALWIVGVRQWSLKKSR